MIAYRRDVAIHRIDALGELSHVQAHRFHVIGQDGDAVGHRSHVGGHLRVHVVGQRRHVLGQAEDEEEPVGREKGEPEQGRVDDEFPATGAGFEAACETLEYCVGRDHYGFRLGGLSATAWWRRARSALIRVLAGHELRREAGKVACAIL